MSTRGTLVLRLAFFIAALVVIALHVRNFSGPLFGTGDTAIWEYLGYYVSQNLTFLPWPSLDLVNDQVFYPYGVSCADHVLLYLMNLYELAHPV